MRNKYEMGGYVPKMANGNIPRFDADGSGPIYGHVEGGNVQTSPDMNSDNVSALLRPGEYVMRSEAVDALGGVGEVDKLNALGGPNNPQKYANQRPPNPSMTQPPLSGRMPLSEITKRDRHGASVTMKFDTKANGGSYQDGDGLWGILNEMQREATQAATRPYQSGGSVPPMKRDVPTFFGGGWLSSLFSPDEERQAELAATAERIKQKDIENAQNVAFGDEAVLETSSQAKKEENDSFIKQFTGQFDGSNNPIYADVHKDNAPTIENSKMLDINMPTVPSMPQRPAWDGRYDGGSGNVSPGTHINKALDNVGAKDYAQVPFKNDLTPPNPDAGAATVNPHEGITGYRDYVELDTAGKMLNANENRILSEERVDELNSRLASNKINQEQYDTLYNDSEQAKFTKNAFDTEQKRLDALKDTETKRLNAAVVAENIEGIDVKIAAAEKNGNQKLIDTLNTEKKRLQGQLPSNDLSTYNADNDVDTSVVETPAEKTQRLKIEKLESDYKVKLEAAQLKIQRLQGSNSTTPKTPEEQESFDQQKQSLIVAGQSGTTGNKADDNWFKKEFTGAFSGIFGDKGIGEALTRGLILYAGGRLTGMTGNQALAFAGQDALDEGTRINTAKSEAIAEARKSRTLRDNWVRNNKTKFGAKGLKLYAKTGNTDYLVPDETPYTFQGFGEPLWIGGYGEVIPQIGPDGTGQYIEDKDNPGQMISISKLQALGTKVQPMRDEFRSEYVIENLSSYSEEVRKSKGIELEGSGLIDTKLADGINDVIQTSAIHYPRLSPQQVMKAGRGAMEDAITYANKYPDAGVVGGEVFMRGRLIQAEHPNIVGPVSGSDPAVLESTNDSITTAASILAASKENMTLYQAEQQIWNETLTSWNDLSQSKAFRKKYTKIGKDQQVSPFLAYAFLLENDDETTLASFTDWTKKSTKKTK